MLFFFFLSLPLKGDLCFSVQGLFSAVMGKTRGSSWAPSSPLSHHTHESFSAKGSFCWLRGLQGKEVSIPAQSHPSGLFWVLERP